MGVGACLGGPIDNNVLENRVTKSGLASSSELTYTMDVPAGATDISVIMSGGTGDVDLFVRHGAQPTSSTYDCRPYKTGNSETCSFNDRASGTWNISLNGYSAASGVTLNITAAP